MTQSDPKAEVASTASRLDQVLAERGLARSRTAARDAILRGTVTVDGEPATRPGLRIRPTQDVRIDDPAARYVARSALKLVAGLDAFAIDPSGLAALDLGASTGGFTQVLLERGARCVTAIDVGHGQLDPTIAADPRVTSIEGLNARSLTAGHLGEAPALIVADLSFISLLQALPSALGLAAPEAQLAALVKPQFEVGRDGIGKGGLVRPGPHVDEALARVRGFVSETAGWSVEGLIPSPIAGGDGNQEYLLAATRRPQT
ncbi:TlyA family RNA methyltransferase [Amorphus coralli]|uniref:TlyA family RNA methyltransferase n=1 Tax=Amorphus coralli TaxID=340680 RepID=UPI00037C74C5|nr:TlyA family RNA methyltransferase [Amorphus coralli]